MGDGIDMMMKAIGPKKKVYWVNLWFGPSPYPDLPSPKQANKILRAKAKQYPNLKVINFASAFREAKKRNPSVGWTDGVHLNTAGGLVRAKAIARGVGKPATGQRAAQ